MCEFLVLGLASKSNKTRIEAIEVRASAHTWLPAWPAVGKPAIRAALPEIASCQPLRLCQATCRITAGVKSCSWRPQVLGELIDQEGIIVYQGARYKPLPAIAQVRPRSACPCSRRLLSLDRPEPPAALAQCACAYEAMDGHANHVILGDW